MLQDDDVRGDDEDMSEKSDEDVEANPLVVPLAEASKASKEHLAKEWFSQDIFEGVNDAEELSDDEEVIAKIKKSKKASERVDDEDEDEDMGVGVSTKGNGYSNGTTHPVPEKENADFEVVPQESSGSSDSDSSDSEDDNGKAETLAYAKKMLRKRSRESILDDAYNRYTFNDVGLPRWFNDDERKHNRPEKPITKDEVEAMKVWKSQPCSSLYLIWNVKLFVWA
jgi:AdoMet-dependent rRNA methyltransferase SPB1